LRLEHHDCRFKDRVASGLVSNVSETPAQEAPAQFFVYYDDSCPICREEIGALKSIDQQNKQVLIDCSDAKFDDVDAAKAGLSKDALQNEMHVRDANGKWHIAGEGLLKRRGVRSLFE